MSKGKTVVTVISKITEKPVTREACLVVIYGFDLGRKFNIEKSPILIGRSSKSDIQIDQESISRTHAKIMNTGKEVVIKDLESTNGTYVNDRAVSEHVLRDGDLVKIGRTIFKFLSGNNIENSYHEEIYRLTTTDGMTQTYNRRFFLETLDREISRAYRYKRPMALIMFDIDHFKKVNDTNGHLAGDSVLKEISNLIKPNIRREDIFARYGGEEFAIILPEVALDGAVTLADKLRGLVEAHTFTFEGIPIPITVSLGCAAIDSETITVNEFIRRADEKLYAAKAGGRNMVCH